MLSGELSKLGWTTSSAVAPLRLVFINSCWKRSGRPRSQLTARA
jgi:hypothetical protein